MLFYAFREIEFTCILRYEQVFHLRATIRGGSLRSNIYKPGLRFT